MSYELAEYYDGGAFEKKYKNRAACVNAGYARKPVAYKKKHTIRHYNALPSTCRAYKGPIAFKRKTRKTVKRPLCKGVPRKKGCRVAKRKLAGCPHTLVQLKAIATKIKLPGRSLMNKAQLCRKLKSMRLI